MPRSIAMRDCIVILVLVAVTCAILVPYQRRQHELRALESCKGNLKNIGTALEMYSTDSSGRFPYPLVCLVPNYLKSIPTCPAANADTYSRMYASLS